MDELCTIERLDWGETLKKVASDLGMDKVIVEAKRSAGDVGRSKLKNSCLNVLNHWV